MEKSPFGSLFGNTTATVTVVDEPPPAQLDSFKIPIKIVEHVINNCYLGDGTVHPGNFKRLAMAKRKIDPDDRASRHCPAHTYEYVAPGSTDYNILFEKSVSRFTISFFTSQIFPNFAENFHRKNSKISFRFIVFKLFLKTNIRLGITLSNYLGLPSIHLAATHPPRRCSRSQPCRHLFLDALCYPLKFTEHGASSRKILWRTENFCMAQTHVPCRILVGVYPEDHTS
jgi:hypothetical protein